MWYMSQGLSNTKTYALSFTPLRPDFQLELRRCKKKPLTSPYLILIAVMDLTKKPT